MTKPQLAAVEPRIRGFIASASLKRALDLGGVLFVQQVSEALSPRPH